MKNLELKHIIPYLSSGTLKGEVYDRESNEIFIDEIESIYLDDKILSFKDAPDFYFDEPFECSFKPYLLPLSCLCEEISRDKTFLHQIAIDLGLLIDDNFLFQYDFSDYGFYGNKYDYAIISPTNNKIISIPQRPEDIINVRYNIFKQLIKHRFDVFGLIEKGLAVSYNDTLMNRHESI